jgi:hypothetical protein
LACDYVGRSNDRCIHNSDWPRAADVGAFRPVNCALSWNQPELLQESADFFSGYVFRSTVQSVLPPSVTIMVGSSTIVIEPVPEAVGSHRNRICFPSDEKLGEDL